MRKNRQKGLGYVPVPISQSSYMPLTPVAVSTTLPTTTPVGYKPKISGNAIGNAISDVFDFFAPKEKPKHQPVIPKPNPYATYKPKTPYEPPKDNTLKYVAIGSGVLIVGTLVTALLLK